MTPYKIATEANALLKSEAEAGRFRGAVLLAWEGEVLVRSGYGFANEEWKIPNSPLTKFRIGSATKTFTAAAILRLVEAGGIDLDDHIGKWIADLPQAWQGLTIHQLLTHTAGLRDHIAAPGKRKLNLTGARPEELVGLIANEPLLFPPGTNRSYSNTGYILLGMLIEKAGKASYARFLADAIFQPLELMATRYDDPSEVLPERASGYMARDGKVRNAEYLDMSVPFSAGGLVSTVDDLLRWNMALHANGFLKQGSYRRMIAEYPETRKEDGHYGYGVFISKRSGYTCLSHSGGVNGFISVVAYYPELRGSLILLSNLLDPRPFSSVFDRLSDLLLSQAEG